MSFKAPLRAFASGVMLLVAGFVLAAGCGGSGTACVPGQSIACSTGKSCGHAFQVCNSDGSGYGECTCGPTAFPPVGPNSGLTGAACESDANCREGLTCVTKDQELVLGEGPSAGICLAPCIPGHDILCTGVEAKAKCVVLDDKGTATTSDDTAYCMLGCNIGDTKDPDKCRSRDDMVCFEEVPGSGIGYCRPACRKDSDCSPRYCDLGTGLCSGASRTGDSIGSLCDPTTDTCAGACHTYSGAYTECTGLCSYGEPGACGQTRTDPPYDYYCYAEDALGSGAGDLGYCARVCNCDSECGRVDNVCEPHPELVAKTGRQGVCGSKALSSGMLRPNTPCKQ
jgi:hypothetical protein